MAGIAAGCGLSAVAPRIGLRLLRSSGARPAGPAREAPNALPPSQDGPRRSATAEAPSRSAGGHQREPAFTHHAANLQYLVDHDQLTGLHNRHGLERKIGELLGRPDRNGGGAVVAFGMDNFRYLNARRGRQVGDLVLTTVASVLESAASDAHAVARIGGDAFAVLLAGADRARAESAARRVLDAVRSADLDVDRAGIRTTASAGIALLDRDLAPADALLEADLAMARAKAAGRDRVAVYTRGEHRPFRVEAEWAEKIREALESSGLELHCQPVRSLRGADGQWELLLRLPQLDGQLLPPEAFLPTAERFGLLERLDAWVFERAVELAERHHAAGRRLELGINLSARSLTDERFGDLVGERVAQADMAPGGLIFEVDERAIENFDEVRVSAERIRQIGCRIALDRFGTGDASLARLKHLPADLLKIDGAFIRHLADEDADRHIVRAIIGLAHGLGRKVVAVHVGDGESLELLEGYGADYAQGFHVGRPRPLAELELEPA